MNDNEDKPAYPVPGGADWISLAAAPIFAIMALVTSPIGGGPPDMLCSAAHGVSLLSGMAPMYLLMSAFHTSPWLKLISRRRSVVPWLLFVVSIVLSVPTQEQTMSLKDKKVVVTGGSRGLGLGLVEALVAHGAGVTIVARDTGALAAVRVRLGVATISADVTEETAAQRILSQIDPDILVPNAGALPPMGRLDQISWEDFTATWETDVRGGLYWLQAALNLPLKPGSRVLAVSSGAAVNGSPLSGGYAGAKRMLWFMAKYADGVSAQKSSGFASRRSCRSKSLATPASAMPAPTPTRAP